MFQRLLLIGLSVGLAACQSAPITGRSQVLLMSLADENALGAQSWDEALGQAKQDGTLVRHGPQAARVQRVGKAIAAAAMRHPETRDLAGSYDWEFVLLNDDQVNAWALPGGRSAVYTGLLKVTQNEAELASVMGHEVAHALARHSGERLSQTLLVHGTLSMAQLFSGDMEPENRALMLASLGVVGQAGVLLPFSRAHESEADHIGLLLAADAGYDPRASVRLWQRMAELSGSRSFEFLSTHPSEATRIERLNELMPKALKIWEKARAAGR
jgi:predicted Zn-dependent protease